MTDIELITSPQVGQLLGKSARTIQRMAERGELAYVTKLPGPNGAFLFDKAAIERIRSEAERVA